MCGVTALLTVSALLLMYHLVDTEIGVNAEVKKWGNSLAVRLPRDLA